MVNFKADHAHFTSALGTINTFRADSSFCDVKLLIGKQSLQAHRNVLAAGSPYFRSLFLRQKANKKKEEINLSEVTNSITALERVVNFIYTGEIDIDNDNIEVIVKLSSFFLIEGLKEFCFMFMADNSSLNTCLREYLYSIDHSASLIEQKTWPMVQSRFHDHLIFEEDTLSISTSEMQFLLEKNILQHCSDVSIIRFVALWVNKGLTERHMVIAREIFEYVNERDNSPQVYSLQVTNELSVDSLYEMTESSLNDIALQGTVSFLNSFKEVLGKLTTEKEIHTAETRSQALHDGKETAIIALFPSNDVMELQRKRRENPDDHALSFATLATDRNILHLCAYIPRTRCWYSLKKIYKDGSSFALLINDSENKPCRFDVLHDELYFIDDSKSEITTNDINKLENSGIKSNSVTELLMSESYDLDALCDEVAYFDFCLTSGKHDSVYLVAIIKRFANEDLERLSGIYFNVYKQNGNGWQQIVQKKIPVRPSIDYESYDVVRPFMHAKISTVSNEMMVQVGEFNTVLVADLNQKNTKPVTVLSSPEDAQSDMDFGKHTQIIETNDAMYIVTDGSTDTTNDKGEVNVMYKYKLNSKQLSKVSAREVNVRQLQEDSHDSTLYPCLSESSASVGDGLWYMEGDDNTSFLTNVTVDDYNNPVIEHHTPPPFHSITAMFAGKISSKILENKETVTRYLGNKLESV